MKLLKQLMVLSTLGLATPLMASTANPTAELFYEGTEAGTWKALVVIDGAEAVEGDVLGTLTPQGFIDNFDTFKSEQTGIANVRVGKTLYRSVVGPMGTHVDLVPSESSERQAKVLVNDGDTTSVFLTKNYTRGTETVSQETDEELYRLRLDVTRDDSTAGYGRVWEKVREFKEGSKWKLKTRYHVREFDPQYVEIKTTVKVFLDETPEEALSTVRHIAYKKVGENENTPQEPNSFPGNYFIVD